MTKIEDIKVEKTFYKREKDALGNVTRTPYQKTVPRPVNVVSPGVRFGYYLIDLIIFYALQFILGFGLGMLLVVMETPMHTMVEIVNLLTFLIFFFYYSVFEGFLGGTVGKLICGYVVIDQYAERITFSKGMLRTLCRIVPFEAFSCFGERGWHDKWSETYVVKKSEHAELRKLLGKMNLNETIID